MIRVNFSAFPMSIVNGEEIPAIEGNEITSLNPFSGEILWSSNNPPISLVIKAIKSAKESFLSWASTTLEERIEILTKFTKIVDEKRQYLVQIVAEEASKPFWEANIEVNSLITKLAASIEAYNIRNKVTSREVKGLISKTRYKPHGVVCVLGPYNFPLSMANGHIMPSLLAGNTVIFKPSELTPLSGIAVSQIWQEAGLPKGVLNCLIGDKTIGKYIVEHNDIDGVFFVGSHQAGITILQSTITSPNKIIAVEMGGNSPLVIEDYDRDKENEIISLIIHSAFITSGQRCSAARRLYINRKSKTILNKLSKVLSNLKIGDINDNPEPFCGAMIRPKFATNVFNQVQELVSKGAREINKCIIEGINKTIVRPTLLDMQQCSHDKDEEIFGPVLKIYYYDDLKEAIEASNNTKFGLAAGIVTQDKSKYDLFYNKIKAGIVNWNQQLTGATTFAPFGGIKQSGNYRPAGYLSADYCSYALASFEVEPSQIKLANTPGIYF